MSNVINKTSINHLETFVGVEVVTEGFKMKPGRFEKCGWFGILKYFKKQFLNFHFYYLTDK